MNTEKRYSIIIALFIITVSALLVITGCVQKSDGSSKKRILYYEDTMKDSKVSLEDYNKGITQCPVCNMALYPVYAEEEASSASKMEEKEELKEDILYYTDAMHPSVKVSPEDYGNGTTQCPICNMDLYPVYAENEEKKTDHKGHEKKKVVKISQREIELAGIRTFKADYYHLSKEIVTVGKVAYDPELVVAEKEYITAIQSAEKMSASLIGESKKRAENLLVEAAYKLKLLGLNDVMINELRKTKKVHNNLILPEKTVWVYADIYEFELGLIEEGQEMTVEATAYPGEYFKGNIKAIDSVLNPKTRSVRIRAEVINEGMKLKPDMYVKVIILKHLGEKLSVPRDAVLDTGKRKLVYVDVGSGEYMQHEVEVGYEAITLINMEKERMINIKKGVAQGDMVVVRANFLLDSQSQLSGPASSQYGGALEGSDDKQQAVPGHQH
ncbi:MAG: efflux RND transporter periplasmic adaptor subunit [Elusimicrobiota bacterium]